MSNKLAKGNQNVGANQKPLTEDCVVEGERALPQKTKKGFFDLTIGDVAKVGAGAAIGAIICGCVMHAKNKKRSSYDEEDEIPADYRQVDEE